MSSGVGAIFERMRIARKALHLSQQEFAERVHTTAQTYSRYERGEREIPSNILASIVDMGISASWLLAGDGEMRPASTAKHEPTSQENLLAGLEAMGFVHLPHYNVDAAAGNGSISEVSQPVRTVGFSREWLLREHSANPADLILMNAKGDSGYDRIKDGDLLLIDTSEPKLRSGNQIYAFVHDGFLFVKRLERRLDGGLVVSSDNSDLFKPEHLSAEQARDLNIIGRVIWNAGKV